MYVFIDESGDPGLKFNQGSSRFFTVTTVVFPTKDVMQACQSAIKSFRSEAGLKQHKEFHFSKDNQGICRGFLAAVASEPFWYGAVVLNKPALTGPGFQHKESLYKYTVNLAFQNIFSSLENATIVFDSCGGREFGLQLRNYVRRKAREHSPDAQRLKKIKSTKSHTDDLVQMADMVCGAVARSYTDRKDRREFRNLLRKRERRVQVWPKIQA